MDRLLLRLEEIYPMRLKLPALLFSLATLGAPSLGHAWLGPDQCTTVLTTSANRGMIEGYYLRGHRAYNDMYGCIDPYEVVQIIVNTTSGDQGRAGSMYVAAGDGKGGAMVLQDNGEWVDYQGGLHAPTARFESLPDSHVITVFDSRGDYDPTDFRANLYRQYTPPPGPALVCDLVRSYGGQNAYFGAGYGAIQDDQQGAIDRLIANPHANIDVDHVRGAFAYTDGLQAKKYGTVFDFECGCSTLPVGAAGHYCDSDWGN